MSVTEMTKKPHDGKMKISFRKNGKTLFETEGYDFGFHVANSSFFFIAKDKEEDGFNNVMVRVDEATTIETSKA